MSQIQLAELLDQLSIENQAVIVESPEQVSISNLSASAAVSVIKHVQLLKWKCVAFDTEGNGWSIGEISEAFAPFRVTLSKEIPLDGSLHILTNSSFASYLHSGHAAKIWRIARISAVLRTRGRLFTPWGHGEDFTPAPATKSPRVLVRETAAQRQAPQDILPWLIVEEEYAYECASSRIWADACIVANLHALPDEIESITGNLKFKGPPRLSLTGGDISSRGFEKLGLDGLLQLQRVIGWIYENEREAEVRHLLFSSEMARSGGGVDDVLLRFRRDGSASFEGAKIAYQMSISELGKDTLKALGDLKKSVTEDTAKITEATRQTTGAVATALAVGLGLLAARATSSTESWLLCSVMFIVVLYVCSIVYSGYSFIKLQRKLRQDWQPRLYRFLSDDDFNRMVKNPAVDAENTFFWTARIGVGAVGLIFIGFLCLAVFFDNPKHARQVKIEKAPVAVPRSDNREKAASDVRNEKKRMQSLDAREKERQHQVSSPGEPIQKPKVTTSLTNPRP